MNLFRVNYKSCRKETGDSRSTCDEDLSQVERFESVSPMVMLEKVMLARKQCGQVALAVGLVSQ